MIEIVYNKGKEKSAGNEEYFCVPKNIRQIGEVPQDTKIYLEDYVYTYLTSDWDKEETKGRIAVLLGTSNWKNDTFYGFVKSAVMMENIMVTKDYYPMTDTVWGNVYEEMKKYFDGQEVIGWYLSLPDGGMKLTDGMIRTHMKHFGGNDKVLLLADPYECESCFYLCRNNRMEKQKGYYIFYEKNTQMQEYILDKNPESQSDHLGKAQDRAVRDFRKIIAQKQKAQKEKESSISWGVVAATGAAALVLVAGTFFYNSKYSVKNERDTDQATVDTKQTMAEKQEENDDGMVLLTPETEKNAAGSGREQENTAQPDIDGENETQQDGIWSDIEKQNTDLPESEKNADQTDGTDDEEEMSKIEDDDIEESNEEKNTKETKGSAYTEYTVRKGDTLSKISMRYYGDFSKVAEICKINNMLEDDIIRVGQTILLP